MSPSGASLMQQPVRRDHAVLIARRHEANDLEAALIGAAAQLQDPGGVVAGAVNQHAALENVFVDEAAGRRRER